MKHNARSISRGTKRQKERQVVEWQRVCIASQKSSAKCRLSRPFLTGNMDAAAHSQEYLPPQSRRKFRRDAEGQENEGCEASGGHLLRAVVR